MNVLPSDFYQRRLPHWHPKGQTFFITFRLTHSLPTHVIRELEQKREHEKKMLSAKYNPVQQRLELELYNLNKKYFGQFDDWLGRCIEESPRWLARENIASIVAKQIHALDGECYRLIAYCIMSNHVHQLIDTADYPAEAASHAGPTASYPLADTMKRLKGHTARHCNLALGRSGAFWHHESYDHVVRDRKEFERILWYILNNPVKAGLVENWEEWPFTYYADQTK